MARLGGAAPAGCPVAPRGPSSSATATCTGRVTDRTSGRTQELGPPRGRGNYSEDKRWWWDEAVGRWFPVTDERDTLEIELEDAGGTSAVASLVTTLGSQFGNAYYRFIGRAHSPDPRWPTYSIRRKTFPAPPAFLANLPPQEQWAEGMTQALNELREELVAQGWQPVGRGAQPWSFAYVRPGLDLDSPVAGTAIGPPATGGSADSF